MTDIPQALVEKAQRVIAANYYSGNDLARAVLAAVWPDVAAARPVVDRDTLAIALHDTECRDHCDPMVMGKYFRQADAILAAGVITDAADVRRQTAEDTLREAADDLHVHRFDHQHGDVGGPDSFYRGVQWARNRLRELRARLAREVGGDRG